MLKSFNSHILTDTDQRVEPKLSLYLQSIMLGDTQKKIFQNSHFLILSYYIMIYNFTSKSSIIVNK